MVSPLPTRIRRIVADIASATRAMLITHKAVLHLNDAFPNRQWSTINLNHLTLEAATRIANSRGRIEPANPIPLQAEPTNVRKFIGLEHRVVVKIACSAWLRPPLFVSDTFHAVFAYCRAFL